uniref:Uncharacterized protein n=1 Tax=Pararge aegeria TaxID=116150 RepID=S4P6K8_9NEOP
MLCLPIISCVEKIRVTGRDNYLVERILTSPARVYYYCLYDIDSSDCKLRHKPVKCDTILAVYKALLVW